MRTLARTSWLLALLPLLGASPPAASPLPDAELRRGCLEATRRAIALELDGYRERLRAARDGLGPEGNAKRFEERLAALEQERARFAGMAPEDYPLPAAEAAPEGALLAAGDWGPVEPPRRRTIPVVVRGPMAPGDPLEVEGRTKSGPFFRVAGIRDGGLGALRAGERHLLDVFLVYRREYFGLVQDHYVFVAGVERR